MDVYDWYVWYVYDVQERVWGRKGGWWLSLRLETDFIVGSICCCHLRLETDLIVGSICCCHCFLSIFWIVLDDDCSLYMYIPSQEAETSKKTLSRSKLSLVGGLEHVLFSHILGIIIPIDSHMFQRGGPTTNQKWFSLEIEGLARELPTADSNSYLTVIWRVKLDFNDSSEIPIRVPGFPNLRNL